MGSTRVRSLHGSRPSTSLVGRWPSPYQWRSMPEIMAEIPELREVGRGGLQQVLKGLIDDARRRVVARLGSEKEQAVRRPVAQAWQTGMSGATGRCVRIEPVPSRTIASQRLFGSFLQRAKA